MTNFAVSARFVYRDLPRVIEDYLCSAEGDYCIGNPTRGRMANLFSLDYNTQFPAPAAKRIYKGFQFEAQKRFADNWTLLASYVYSTLQGNYDGLFAPYTQPRGTADPNISALYDYYDFSRAAPSVNGVAQPVTSTGDLSNDRRSVAKISGVYVTPFNLTVGLVTYYQTGVPIFVSGSPMHIRGRSSSSTAAAPRDGPNPPTTPTSTSAIRCSWARSR